jgi:hypothetical protein
MAGDCLASSRHTRQMSRHSTLTVLAVAAGLTLAACSNTPAATTVPPAATTAAAATPSGSPTPAAPTPAPTTPGNLRPGQSVNAGTLVIATYYAYKQPVAKSAPRPAADGYTWGAIDIKVCAVNGHGPDLEVSATSWTLVYADSTTARPSNITYNQFPQPGYPYDTNVPWGRCIRGWLTFAVPPSGKPTMVEYQPSSGTFDWSVS